MLWSCFSSGRRSGPAPRSNGWRVPPPSPCLGLCSCSKGSSCVAGRKTDARAWATDQRADLLQECFEVKSELSMSDTILVVVEQREGKLNRVSWETIAAGQAIAADTG